MWKTEAKGAKNAVRTRGGINFFNSLRHTLYVNKAVRSRALKDRNCTKPVRCDAEIMCMSKGINKQQTVGKFEKEEKFLKRVPKVWSKFDLAQTSSSAGPNAAPVKFFCLPMFDLQEENVGRCEPQSHEDAFEFLFVDINKFLARNSSSVLHNAIFRSKIPQLRAAVFIVDVAM